MRALVVRHVAFEDLGTFGDALDRRGYTLDLRQAGLDTITREDWTTADLVVVLGGPIGAYDTDTYPWLVDEIEGLRARLQQKRPTLGVCLGAQLMARALGAQVRPGTTKEIGWCELTLTLAGRNSCLSSLEDVPVLHWHGDVFELPRGATLLASTEQTPHQAFAVERHALALQFHAEVAPSRIEPWLIGHACELGQASVSVPALRARSAAQGTKIVTAGSAMIERWLDELGPR
jgi:GMP synthase (glutamine-hydrolysing)